MNHVRRVCSLQSLTVLAVSLLALSSFLCFGAAPVLAQGPLLDENFDYGDAAGDLTVVSGGNWVSFSGTVPVQYVPSSLSFPGYVSSGIGGSATIAGSGSEDVHRAFDAQTAGDVYYAALVNLSSATSTGTYFLSLKDSGTSNYRGRFFAQDVSGSLHFGLSSSSTGAYSSVDFAYNTTYLVIVKYNVTTADSALYVLDIFNPIEPAIPLLTSTGTAGSVSTVAIRQGSGGPTGTIDGIRVATTWDGAVGNAAALSIQKSASALMVGSGDPLAYTIQVENTGLDSAATSVIITDVLPVGTDWAWGGNYDNGVIAFTNLPTIPVGSAISVTFGVTVTAPAGSDVVNDDYRVSCTEWPTPTIGEPITVAVSAVDLIVGKSGPGCAAAGADMVYTIELQNVGVTTATNVILTDTLPVSVTYVSDNSGVVPTNPSPGEYVWSFGDVLSNAITTFNLTVTVDAEVADGSILTNTVNATTDVPGDDLANNEASWATSVYQVVPIATARARADFEYAAITGTITAKPGIYNNYVMFVQDSSGGIEIYDGNLTGLGYDEGDVLRVVGHLETYQGIRELVPCSIEVLSVGTMPAPIVYATGDVTYTTEGWWIQVEGFVSSIVPAGSNRKFNLDDGSGPVEIFVDGSSPGLVAWFEANVHVGEYWRIQGVAARYYETPQVWPRYSTDFTELYPVTFVYHDVEDVVYSGEDVYIAGTFNGWNSNANALNANADHSVFSATITLPMTGTYEYKYIVKSGGDQWDWLNTSNRSVEVTSPTTVDDYRNVSVGYAHLMMPPAITIALGETTEDIYGEVYIQNVTNPPGLGRAVWAELGYGMEVDPGLWAWTAMDYTDTQNGNNDIYTDTLTPMASGVYSYAVRFDGNRGPGNPNAGWTYGDLDGVYPGEPFELSQTGVLTVLAPELTIDKTVTPKENITLGSVVTYTVVMGNAGNADALGVVMTDVLPVEVDFGGWVEQNGAIQANDVLSWTGDISAGAELTFIFTATVGLNESFYGRTVTNTAYFVSDNAGSGSDGTGFTIGEAPPRFNVYLPIVVKNY
jgi:uncharacterized repeat protein (TIGR01451 family)